MKTVEDLILIKELDVNSNMKDSFDLKKYLIYCISKYENQYNVNYKKMILVQNIKLKNNDGIGNNFPEYTISEFIKMLETESVKLVKIYKDNINNNLLMKYETSTEFREATILIVTEEKIKKYNLDVGNLRKSCLKQNLYMKTIFTSLKHRKV